MITLTWVQVAALSLLRKHAKGDGIEILDAEHILLTNYYGRQMVVVWNPEARQYFRKDEPKEVSDNAEDFNWRNDQ